LEMLCQAILRLLGAVAEIVARSRERSDPK